jgi:hypothetical protein
MGSIIQFGLALHNTSSENTNLDKALTERSQEWWQKERRPGGGGGGQVVWATIALLLEDRY